MEGSREFSNQSEGTAACVPRATRKKGKGAVRGGRYRKAAVLLMMFW